MAWVRQATSPSVVRRASAVAVVVGTVLVAINHGDALLRRVQEHSRAISPSRRGSSAKRSSELARPAGLEPAATGLEGRCSIQLSYGRVGF